MRIEIRLPIERLLVPPLARLAHRNDDHVLLHAPRSPRQRRLVGVRVHRRARVLRQANRSLERRDLCELSHTPLQLDLRLLEACPVLRTDLPRALGPPRSAPP